MLRFVWPLLLCLSIPASAWMGPVLVGGTVPAAAGPSYSVGVADNLTTATATLGATNLYYIGGSTSTDSTFPVGIGTGNVTHCHVHATAWASSAVGVGIYSVSGATATLLDDGNATVSATDQVVTFSLDTPVAITNGTKYALAVATTDISWSGYRGAYTPTLNTRFVSHTYNGSSMPSSFDMSASSTLYTGQPIQILCTNSATPPW